MKVLVVEDEKKIAAALKKGLEREGYVVDTADNSDDGLDAALSDEYSVIVLDRMLPGSLEGAEVCAKVRDEGINTPIIMLTAKDAVRDRIGGLDAGADDYLVKPFAFEELVARIRALLRRPGDSKGNILSASDLTLNTVSYEVRRAGKLITLSSKEFTLLHYLMRHEGQVLPKHKLITNVWEFDADILENTVEVYIGYLRAKIDKPFEKKLIHTIRGFGYRFGTE